MKITIVGAGNAGCAHAFKFSEKGHSVCLLKTSNTMHDDNFEAIKRNGGIWAIDHTNNDFRSFQKIYLMTRDIKVALKEAELIIIQTQSLQHQAIAKLVCPYITDKTKMILIIPGNMGSLYFWKQLQNKNIILCEGESTPYDARITELGMVNILFKNRRNALSFLPSSRKQDGMAIAMQLVDTYGYYRRNIVETLLHNPNLVVHTIGTIMSANRIENMNGEFWMYRESFSPSIWKLINKLDDEKNDIIEFFGGERISYLDACKFRNADDLSEDSLTVFRKYAADGGPKGPNSLNTRYIYEDVAVDLCILSSLGRRFGVKTPVCDALITLASALVGRDFANEGISISSFGLDTLSNADIINLVNS
jgi:opine dehydrogenase